ncbi:MAG: hypothetical protein LC746_01625 [Acidobacteria bacterium]|nr:hypothetical protein [Acidobacteriota bacterium]
MTFSNTLTGARALALLACLSLCPLATNAFAQENANGGSATQNAQQSNRSTTSTQTTRTTTTTTAAPSPATQTQPAQTSVSVARNTNSPAPGGTGGIDPLWLIIGAVVLLAILLVVVLSARGRSRSSGTRVETVRETTIKKE